MFSSTFTQRERERERERVCVFFSFSYCVCFLLLTERERPREDTIFTQISFFCVEFFLAGALDFSKLPENHHNLPCSLLE